MKQLKFALDRKSLPSIYFSFILPVLEYADVVWDNCIQGEANELENIQTEAARIVIGSTKLVSIDTLYTETGWETLKSRRNKHKLTLFYKMKSGMSPHYLTTIIPPIVGNTSTYNLRNSNDMGTVHANSKLCYNSFLPSVIRKWKELPEDTRQSSNIASFKTHLNRDRIAPPSYNMLKRVMDKYIIRD